MSDMSYNQAKHLAERLELTEITLNKTLKQINSATKSFEDTLVKQEKIASFLPKANTDLHTMKLIVAINIGFILGLLVSKYII